MAEVPKKTNPLSKWLRMLTGKPVATQASGQKTTVAGETEIKPEDIKKEGILAQGVRGIKEAVSKVTPAPYTKEEEKGSGTKPSEAVKKGFPKPLLGVFVAVVLLLIISLLASRFAPALRKGGKGGGETTILPTPSPVGYIKYKPSVYAGDPKVLQLEEEVNILDGEVRNVILKDDTLKPPTIDFNIKF